MSVLPVCVYMYDMHSWCRLRQEEVVWSPGIAAGCELSYGWWELNLGSSSKVQVFLTSEVLPAPNKHPWLSYLRGKFYVAHFQYILDIYNYRKQLPWQNVTRDGPPLKVLIHVAWFLWGIPKIDLGLGGIWNFSGHRITPHFLQICSELWVCCGQGEMVPISNTWNQTKSVDTNYTYFQYFCFDSGFSYCLCSWNSVICNLLKCNTIHLFWNWVRVVITMTFSAYQKLGTFLFSMVGRVVLSSEIFINL